jgi:hypothetical protein
MQNKVVVKGKVDKDKTHNKKFKIKSHKDSESDLTIELTGEGEYEVEKLSVDGLPTAMTDGNPIRWLNNFYIKKNGQHINERFFVTIPNIESSRLVIYDGNGNPYYYTGEIINNTFELTDGDPAVGRVP